MRAPSDFGISSGFVDLGNGLKLHYLSAGKETSPPLIFLHGFPEHSYAWKYYLSEFCKTHFVLAPDMRGYNLSSKPEKIQAYQIHNLIEDVFLFGRKWAPKFSLVGHDWGGLVSWSFAMAYPEIIEKLTIVNCPHPLVWRETYNDPKLDQRNLSSYIDGHSDPNRVELYLSNDCERPRKVLFELGGQATEFFDVEMKSQYIKAWTQPGAMNAGINYYRAMNWPLTPIPTNILAGKVIPNPTLLLWGVKDKWFIHQNIQRPSLKRYVPNLEIHEFPDAGHFVHHEDRDGVIRRLKAHLGVT